MKTLMISLIFLAFLFTMVKRSLSRLGIINKKDFSKKSLISDNKKNNICEVEPPFLSSDFDFCDGLSRHEVHVFNWAECESGTYFAGLIDAKLSIIESEMREKGYSYKLRYLVLNNAIVCIVEYRLKNVLSSLPEVKS